MSASSDYTSARLNSKDPNSITGLLANRRCSGLQRIRRQAERLLVVDRLIAQYLPKEIVPHCHTGQITACELVLIVDSAAWLMQLRFLTASIVQKLRQHPQLANLKTLKFQIRPPVVAGKYEGKEESVVASMPRTFSAETQAILRETADSLTDPDLQRAWLKLANKKPEIDK